jgi:sensor histidine kinase YesM
MKSNNSHIDRPKVTAKGTAMAIFFWLLYTLFSTALLSYSENLAFIYAFSGMAMSSTIMAVLMIPAWFLIVRGMHPYNGWIKAVAHLITGTIYTFSWYYLYLWIFDLTVGRQLLDESFTQNSQWILFTTFMVYVITFAVIHTIESLKQLRLKEKQAAELKELSRQQEISTLKAQLNPHFLFNAKQYQCYGHQRSRKNQGNDFEIIRNASVLSGQL